jgi:hypothetical protein
MGYDVFLSYSSKDKPVADAACAAIEARGLRCWIAPRDIVAGKEWGAAIIEGIEESRVFVLVFSGNANESRQVNREVERAVAKGIPIIPFRIQDVPASKSLEYFISAQHWLDAYPPPLEPHLHKLCETLRHLIAGGKALSPTVKLKQPAPPPPLSVAAPPPLPASPPRPPAPAIAPIAGARRSRALLFAVLAGVVLTGGILGLGAMLGWFGRKPDANGGSAKEQLNEDFRSAADGSVPTGWRMDEAVRIRRTMDDPPHLAAVGGTADSRWQVEPPPLAIRGNFYLECDLQLMDGRYVELNFRGASSKALAVRATSGWGSLHLILRIGETDYGYQNTPVPQAARFRLRLERNGKRWAAIVNGQKVAEHEQEADDAIAGVQFTMPGGDQARIYALRIGRLGE